MNGRPFSVGAGVRSDVTTPAAQEILKEIRKLVDAGVTSAELAMAKDSYARSLPGYFETTESTVASLSSLFVYGLAHTDLAVGATLSSLAPLMSVPFALLYREERWSLPRFTAVTATVAGVVILIVGA